MQSMFIMGAVVLVFYFIVWRPEQKRRKLIATQRGNMKKGDRVTAAGIIGTVIKIQDQTVVLKMVDGAKIEVVKAAITEVQPGSSSSAQEEAEAPVVETVSS